MVDIREIIAENSKYNDKDLRKFFEKDLANYINDTISAVDTKGHNIIVELDPSAYPSMFYCKIEKDDPNTKEYGMDVYYFINVDGIYQATLSLLAFYNKKLSCGTTTVEVERDERYIESEDQEYYIQICSNDIFDFKQLITKTVVHPSFMEVVA